MTAQRHPDGPVVVVGSGLAGWSAVREFRKLDNTTPVLMITGDAGAFYAKPALSNALAQGKAAAQLVTTPAEKMVATLGVTLLQHTHVTGIDVQTQEVHTASKGSFGYRQLVLATGAKAIRLSFMGNAADEEGQARANNSKLCSWKLLVLCIACHCLKALKVSEASADP